MSLIGLRVATAPALPWLVPLASLLAFLAILGNFVVAVRRSALPWHDRFAGTEVVRGR